MKNSYAQGLVNVIKSGVSEDTALKNLFATLAKQGRTKLLPQIARDVELLTQQARASVSILEVANADAKKLAKEDGVEAVDVKENPTLLSGYRLRSGSTLTDKSGKRALLDLFKAITHA